MSNGLPSEEVAEDYKNSLEDLTMNSRYEISSLTVIAKENTEHGMAISRVLENHIRNTPPDRKLPALYVLDSIVKNVGTPYTLFLGRNLYQTFMNAYSLVNNQVRKKLDEMLKTWKEPVPGSLDPRPVFPVETTRPIENALIKARTLAVQQQQQQAKTQQEMLSRNRALATPSTMWRNTPTPPQSNGRFPPVPGPGYPPQSYPPSNLSSNQAQIRSPYPTFQSYAPPQQVPPSFAPAYQLPSTYHVQPQPPPTNSLESLHQDISDLITAARNEFATSPFDTAFQQRLKALLDLQSILRNQQLPPDQIQLIRNQVTQLSNTSKSRPNASATVHEAPIANTPLQPATPLQATQRQPDLQALLSSNALAELLATAAKAQQPTPPPPVHLSSSLPIQPPVVQPPVTSTPVPLSEMPLIASLKAAGMLPPTSTTPMNSVSHTPHTLYAYPMGEPGVQTPPVPSINITRTSVAPLDENIKLTSASLRIPRRQLLSKLYEARSNQCSTCGRRFFATEEGRKKKARHLDWHFRTNQRLADSARRGQSRSWYIDEMGWIKYRDHNEDGEDEAPNGAETSKAQAAAAAAKNDPKNKYIPVPNDAVLVPLPCPICQEKFETSWNDEAQDFVWMDAVRIGGRVYHASCHDEMKKAGGNTPLRTSTPDSVLGKRKIGMNENENSRSKLPKEAKT